MKEPKLLKDYQEELGIPAKSFVVDGVIRFFCTDLNGDLQQIYPTNDKIYEDEILADFAFINSFNFLINALTQGMNMVGDSSEEMFDHFWNVAINGCDFDFQPIKNVIKDSLLKKQGANTHL